MDLREQFGAAGRQACLAVGQPGSTQRLPAAIPSDEELAAGVPARRRPPATPQRLAPGRSAGQGGRLAGESRARPAPVAGKEA